MEAKPKSKRTRNIIIIVSSLFVIFSVLVGFKMHDKYRQFKDGGPLMFMLNKMADELDLNAQQKQQVEAIKGEIKTKMESRKDKRDDHMKIFGEMFKQDNLDKQSIKQEMAKHEAEREEMKDFFIDELVKFHDILTSSQRIKAVEKMADLKAGMHEKFKDMHDKFKPETH